MHGMVPQFRVGETNVESSSHGGDLEFRWVAKSAEEKVDLTFHRIGEDSVELSCSQVLLGKSSETCI